MSNDNRVFKFAGTSRPKAGAALKTRWTNDEDRTKVLTKGGQTEINFVKLPEFMDKKAATQYLIDSNFANGNAEIADCLAATMVKLSPAPTPVATEGGEGSVVSGDAPVAEAPKKRTRRTKAQISADAVAAAQAAEPTATGDKELESA